MEFRYIEDYKPMEDLNLREELVKIIRKHIAKREPGDQGTRRDSAWMRSDKMRQKRMHEAFQARTFAQETSWVEQLTTIIGELEEKPEWKTTLEKFHLGNQGDLKRLGDWKKSYSREYNYLVPIAVIQDMLDNNHMTLLEVFEEATSPGKRYSKYNWRREDLERLEGKKEEKTQQEEENPPKKMRPRGEQTVQRMLGSLGGTQLEDDLENQDQRPKMILKANGRFLSTITETNLDHLGLSYSASITNKIKSPGNITQEINFYGKNKSRTTVFKRVPEVPEDMENRILSLLKDGKTMQQAEIEIRNAKPRDEKTEKNEEFYMAQENAITDRQRDRIWRKCNICEEFGYRWEFQANLRQRHFWNFHSKSMKVEMVTLKKGEKDERKQKFVEALMPVVKIQHLNMGEKRKMKHTKPLPVETQMKHKERYMKKAAEIEEEA